MSLKVVHSTHKFHSRHEAEHSNDKSYEVYKGIWQGSEYTQTYYEDGSSEVDFGGPCGPIYVDEFGET